MRVKDLYKEETERGLAVICSVNMIKAPEKQIEAIEKKMKSKIKLSQPFQLLKTISGIGEILAMVIMPEAGAMSRFASVAAFLISNPELYCAVPSRLHSTKALAAARLIS